MGNIYECETCGVVTKTESRVCVPKQHKDKEQFCGFSKPRTSMCQPVKESLPYSCGDCGRPAQQPELLCNPLTIGT